MKKIVISIIIVVFVWAVYFLFFRHLNLEEVSNTSQNNLTKLQDPFANPAEDIVDMDIVKKIVPKEHSFGATPFLSWNTSKYGRVYATVCSSPKNIFPCDWCTDAGTNFYDREGNLIENCFGMPDNITPPDNPVLCGYFSTLDYKDADYISDSTIQNCPELNSK
ncbi:hypothetical protein HOB10_01760 [Candidatus Parcubacteria bacterium]|jgi:hypothetical protein|nr:hypothetical protein [Candidatus Parcubacteria bacterium]